MDKGGNQLGKSQLSLVWSEIRTIAPTWNMANLDNYPAEQWFLSRSVNIPHFFANKRAAAPPNPSKDRTVKVILLQTLFFIDAESTHHESIDICPNGRTTWVNSTSPTSKASTLMVSYRGERPWRTKSGLEVGMLPPLPIWDNMFKTLQKKRSS